MTKYSQLTDEHTTAADRGMFVFFANSSEVVRPGNAPAPADRFDSPLFGYWQKKTAPRDWPAWWRYA